MEIESAVGGQLGKLIDDGVTAEEVERAQNQLLAGAIYAQDSLASGPRLYGGMLAIGATVADIDAWPQRISAVTPADVIAAARHVWRPERLVTGDADAAGRQPVTRLAPALPRSCSLAASGCRPPPARSISRP